MAEHRQWFEEWFDTPFYHILYGNHDELEARKFIRNLIQYLRPPPNSTFLDLACGKGRHARVIHQLGYRIHGLDLSQNSIDLAKDYEEDGISFSIGDMRQCYFPSRFEFVLNLFTSFGYFNNVEDQVKTLRSINLQLKTNGLLILDYMNVHKAEEEIGEGLQSKVTNQGIRFDIQKSLTENFIEKRIEFKVNDQKFRFNERVSRLHVEDFRSLLEKCGFEMQTIFGDYELNEFIPGLSDRLIMVAKKR